jgi:hypothetical protein
VPERQRLHRLWAGALAAGLLLTGCASIPTSGPVRAGNEVALDDDQQTVQVSPQGPVADRPPLEIVRGFLAASASSESGHAVARKFLAPEVAEQWRPEPRVVIYDGSSTSLSVRGERVTLSTRQVAAIDADGRYEQLASARQVQARFDMRQVDGQWRISALEDGLYLTDPVVRRAFRQYHLYFLTPDRQKVVPEPVLLSQRQGLATALTQRLLNGPSAGFRPGVTTAFPEETALAISSVVVENGVARIDLNDAALAASTTEKQAMSAQLVWTLRQLADVRAVRLTVKGLPLEIGGVEAVDQPVDSWRGYDPDIVVSTEPYFLRGEALGQLKADGGFTFVAGPLGDGTQPVRSVAVQDGSSGVAAITPDGTQLVMGAIVDGKPLQPRLTARDLAPPDWERGGGVWVTDRATGEVSVVDPDGAVEEVGLPDLRAARVQALRVSPDGTRVVARVRDGERDQVWVGVIVRVAGRAPRIESFRRIAPSLAEVRDVAWSASSRLVVLGREADGLFQLTTSDLDGYDIVATTALPEPLTVAAAPGQPLIAATTDGQVYQLVGRTWRDLGEGSDPVYPG